MGFKENLKAELTYQDMLVKELAALSGVNKFSINNYLNARGQVPSAEAAVKIARVLGVSVEYLVMGEESRTETEDAGGHVRSSGLSAETRMIARLAEQLDVEKRKFVLDFICWIKSRKTANPV
jgi:transcriptional regulator with XRE-family HTH domain